MSSRPQLRLTQLTSFTLKEGATYLYGLDAQGKVWWDRLDGNTLGWRALDMSVSLTHVHELAPVLDTDVPAEPPPPFEFRLGWQSISVKPGPEDLSKTGTVLAESTGGHLLFVLAEHLSASYHVRWCSPKWLRTL